MASEPNLAERGMAIGLRALNWLANSDLLDRLGIRDQTERFLHTASKTSARTAARAGRTFAAAQKRSRPARQPSAGRSDLFDVTPSEEQGMLQDSVREFSLSELRAVAELCSEKLPTLSEAGRAPPKRSAAKS